MTTLHDVGTQTFSWRPVKGVKKTIEVYAGSDVFGTLRQERGRPSVVAIDGSRWVFEKDKGVVTVRAEDGSALATFVAGKGGEGTLTLADGRILHWAPTKKGQAERAFYDETGARIVRFWKDWQVLKVEDRGEADPGMAARPEFSLLVALGRVIGIGSDDDGAIAAVIAATGV